MEELTVAERISHYMNKYGMSNSDVVQRLGISTKSWQRYRSNPDLMRYGVIKKLCSLFNVNIETLLEGRS